MLLVVGKYKISVTSDEVDLILRVMDPDQSGSITMQEWLDFMLATEENLEGNTLAAEQSQNAINAERSFMDEGLQSMQNMATDSIGAVSKGLDSTLGAVPLVGQLTDTVVRGHALTSRTSSARPWPPA